MTRGHIRQLSLKNVLDTDTLKQADQYFGVLGVLHKKIVWRHGFNHPYSDVLFGLSAEDFEHEKELGIAHLAVWGDAQERAKNP